MITSLRIPMTHIVQEYISANQNITEKNLIEKFNEFLENEMIMNNIKTGFKQINDYKKGKIKLQSADDFLNEF